MGKLGYEFRGSKRKQLLKQALARMPADALTVLDSYEVYDDNSDSSFSVAKDGKLDFIKACTGNTFRFTVHVDTLDCLFYDLSRNPRSRTQPTSPHFAGALSLNS